jgi:predicted ATP-grasp superfamily ATP-dependent carboligase
VVIGATLPGTTSLVRSLGRRGIHVTLIDRRHGVPMTSRFATESVVIPAAAMSQEREGPFVEHRRPPTEWLVDHLVSSYPPGTVLISGSDEGSWFLAHEHQRLAPRFVVTTAPWEHVETLWTKSTAWTLATEVGCASPDW